MAKQEGPSKRTNGKTTFLETRLSKQDHFEWSRERACAWEPSCMRVIGR